MKNPEIVEISNKMSPEIKFSSDSVRLLAPKLLNYAKIREIFFYYLNYLSFKQQEIRLYPLLKKTPIFIKN